MDDRPAPTPLSQHQPPEPTFEQVYEDPMDELMSMWQCPACAALSRLIDLPADPRGRFTCPVCQSIIVGECDE